jgi:hypothetical protein
VHENDGGAEQIASNLSWREVFFHRNPTRGVVKTDEFVFDRPQKIAVDSYIAVPMASTAKPTLRTGFTVTDALSGCVLGGYFKTSGNSWLAAYKSRLPYVTVAGAVSNDGSTDDRLIVSGGLASTLFTDSARDSAVNVGVEVKSSKFSTKQKSFPDGIASITGKIESVHFAQRVRAQCSRDLSCAFVAHGYSCVACSFPGTTSLAGTLTRVCAHATTPTRRPNSSRSRFLTRQCLITYLFL